MEHQMLSKVWMIPWSVKGFDEYQSSLVLFDEHVMKQQAEANPERGRILFETIDLTPEEEASILQAMRNIFE
jgi:hypothetical protein